jgi:hypothetical protein
LLDIYCEQCRELAALLQRAAGDAEARRRESRPVSRFKRLDAAE